MKGDAYLEPAPASAGIAPAPTTGTATAAATHPAATGSRRASLAVAVTAIHRTVGHRLERQLVDRLSAICALEVKMPYVDHPSLSKTHSISFCSLGPPSTDCRRRSLPAYTVLQSYAKGKDAPRGPASAQPRGSARVALAPSPGRDRVKRPTLCPLADLIPGRLRPALEVGKDPTERYDSNAAISWARSRGRRASSSYWTPAGSRPPERDPSPSARRGSRADRAGLRLPRRDPVPPTCPVST